jgi:hypothetical protein
MKEKYFNAFYFSIRDSVWVSVCDSIWDSVKHSVNDCVKTHVWMSNSSARNTITLNLKGNVVQRSEDIIKKLNGNQRS